MDNYYQKYLKYKSKYLELKSIIGGGGKCNKCTGKELDTNNKLIPECVGFISRGNHSDICKCKCKKGLHWRD